MAPASLSITIEHVLRDMGPVEFWIDILVNDEYTASVGPFPTEFARETRRLEMVAELMSLNEFSIGSRP